MNDRIAPPTISTVPASDSQAPSSGSCSDATGGGSISCAATTTNAMPTSQGTTRLSTYSTSGVIKPTAPMTLATANAARNRSTNSNTAHALNAPYQSRNSPTRSSKAPNASTNGPISNLRVIASSLTSDPAGSPHAPIALDFVLRLTGGVSGSGAWACSDQTLRFVSRPGVNSPLLTERPGRRHDQAVRSPFRPRPTPPPTQRDAP